MVTVWYGVVVIIRPDDESRVNSARWVSLGLGVLGMAFYSCVIATATGCIPLAVEK